MGSGKKNHPYKYCIKNAIRASSTPICKKRIFDKNSHKLEPEAGPDFFNSDFELIK